MAIPILRVKDQNGNVVDIPAIRGTSPHIGENGNWWIGNTDTGVSAHGMPVKPGEKILAPNTYYQLGEVSELSVELGAGYAGIASEYVFEFAPAEGFTGLTISPEVTWLGDPQFPVGKRCVVSVCMGLAVMGCG